MTMVMPSIVELLKNSHDFDAGPAIEISGRLIRQKHFRAVDQGARDGDTLLLTAGKLTGMMIFAARQSDRSQNIVRSCAQFGVGQSTRAVK